MKVYESLWMLTKATIFHNIFLVKSLTFVPFCSLEMYFLHFVILYRDEWNFSVCYCTISPLDNIGKYFAIIKWKVIFPISQILKDNAWAKFSMLKPADTWHSLILQYLPKWPYLKLKTRPKKLLGYLQLNFDLPDTLRGIENEGRRETAILTGINSNN